MICPDCGRDVEVKPKGPFRVSCFVAHNNRRITEDYGRMTPAEMNAWRADHERSSRANETDRCPGSGKPV